MGAHPVYPFAGDECKLVFIDPRMGIMITRVVRGVRWVRVVFARVICVPARFRLSFANKSDRIGKGCFHQFVHGIEGSVFKNILGLPGNKYPTCWVSFFFLSPLIISILFQAYVTITVCVFSLATARKSAHALYSDASFRSNRGDIHASHVRTCTPHPSEKYAG